jgi:hypothetical protein
MICIGRDIQDWLRFLGVTIFIASLYFVRFICHLQIFYHLLRGCLFNLDSSFFTYCDECGPVYC